MENRKNYALIGAFLLIVGVFTPFMTLPFYGTMNYFRGGTGDGVILLLLGLISALLAIRYKFGGLWITGLLSIALLAFTFFRITDGLNQFRNDGGVSSRIVDLVKFEWGWGVLLMGIVLLFAAAAMKSEQVTGKTDS